MNPEHENNERRSSSSQPQNQPDVEIFDPPMCCSTGLCGPTLDQTLLDVSEMILGLQRDHLRVERYQMASHPNAFLGNAEVMQLVREKQMPALPITVVLGKVIKYGEYPTLGEVRAALNGARDRGVSNEEITEALLVARSMKQATVNDTVSNAFRWLSPEK